MTGLLVAMIPGADIALTAATTRTLLQVLAPTNHRVKLTKLSVTCEGVVVTDTPILIELLRQTTAGTMTAITERVIDPPGADETPQTVGTHSATSTEPTAGDILDEWFVHPQSGFAIVFPLNQQPAIPGGGRLAIRATAPQAVDVRCSVWVDE